MLALIASEAKKMKAKLIAIDSLSALSINAANKKIFVPLEKEPALSKEIEVERPISEFTIQQFVYNFLEALKQIDALKILVGEAPQQGEFLTRDKVSEFITDGVILLQHIPSSGGANRTITVIKMRGTKIDDSIHPMKITNKGIEVLSRESLYK